MINFIVAVFRVSVSQPKLFILTLVRQGRAYVSNTKLRLVKNTDSGYVALPPKGKEHRLAVPIGADIKQYPQFGDADFEYYEKIPNNRWRALDRNNHVLGIIYADTFPSCSIDYPNVDQLLGYDLQAPPKSAYSEDIDIVLTWVNSNDTNWASIYNLHSKAERKKSPRDAVSMSRFDAADELKYVLRSIHFNFEGSGKIFIVSNCEIPDWLDADNQRVFWIKHEGLIPDQFLPTFNSHVIESYLHRIEGLSENFVYFNDDIFILRKMSAGDFFSEEGKSYAFLDSFGSVSGQQNHAEPSYMNASRHSSELLLKEFGKYPAQLHKHTVYALKKSVLFDIEDRFETKIDEMRQNKFRRNFSDLNITSFLYHHYALISGQSIPVDTNSEYIANNDIRWLYKLGRVDVDRFDFLCLNKAGHYRVSRLWRQKTAGFLENTFPDQAPWEGYKSDA